MVDYGSGVDLDVYWDLTVDETGDIAGVDGTEELKKDLAFNVAAALRTGRGVQSPDSVANGALGGPLSPGLLSDIEIVVSDIIADDPRIVEVIRVDSQELDDDPNGVDIQARARLETTTTNFRFVVLPE